jgi:Zn-finger nucleic acid-binding protein
MDPSLNCPTCGAARGAGEALVAENSIVNSCRACGGVWVAANVFQELLRQAGPDGSDVDVGKRGLKKAGGKRRPRTRAKPVSRKDRARQGDPAYLPCPVCQALMARQNFAHRSGVKVHVCRQHGVWFEDEETLEDLVEWVKSGGLAAAREEQEAEESHNERIKVRLARERLDGSFDPAEEWPF